MAAAGRRVETGFAHVPGAPVVPGIQAGPAGGFGQGQPWDTAAPDVPLAGRADYASGQTRDFAGVSDDETSDAVKLSSCLGKFLRVSGEGDVLVVVLAGDQAVVEAAEHAAEQVALGGGVPVAGVAPAVVVAAGPG